MTGDLQESKLKEIPNYDINEMQRDIEKQKVEEDQSRNSSTFPIVTVSNVSYHEINYRYDRNDKRFEYDASEIFIANEVQDGNSQGVLLCNSLAESYECRHQVQNVKHDSEGGQHPANGE